MLEKKNFEVNSKIELPQGVINGQGCGQVAKMRFGLFPMSYNGCEMIAIYNLCVLTGVRGVHRLDEICLEMYPKCGVAWGIFGSNVYKLNKYFDVRGIGIRKFYRRDRFFEELCTAKYGIISFWNSNNPLKGVHTVCVEKTPGGIRVYNRFNSKDFPYDYDTVNEVVSKSRFMCGYCLKK